MKKPPRITNYLPVILFLFIFIAPVFADGDETYKKAEELESRLYYGAASKLYEKARIEYKNEGRTDKMILARHKKLAMDTFLDTFPFTEEEAVKKTKEYFSLATDAEREKMLAGVGKDRQIIDGKPRYFRNFLDNIVFRNPLLAEKVPGLMNIKRKYNEFYGGIIFRDLDKVYQIKKWNSFIYPQKYMFTSTVHIPRNELPQKGLYKVWVAAPIQLDCQRDVKAVTVEPAKYLKRPPLFNEDIGSAYFEIPLEELKGDLNIKTVYTFTRYEQYFSVDPAKVGEYDKESDLYKKYTASGPNIVITPELRKKALEIVGDEKNPYLQAKKLNYYVVTQYKYSLMPHYWLIHTDRPESTFVFENGHGDCGSQSMFFSALCRSIGIPARATGGYLLTPGHPSGHFWAEFYIPNYGWLPVDPTIDEAVLYTDQLTPEKREKVHDYYFGHLDNRRMAIQKDVDASVTPKLKDVPEFGITIQSPYAECDEMNESPQIPLYKGHSYKVESIY